MTERFSSSGLWRIFIDGRASELTFSLSRYSRLAYRWTAVHRGRRHRVLRENFGREREAIDDDGCVRSSSSWVLRRSAGSRTRKPKRVGRLISTRRFHSAGHQLGPALRLSVQV